MKRKAFITGITGQDGSYLVENLLDKDYEVHGIRRKVSQDNTINIDHLIEDSKIYNKSFFLHYGDITDTSSLVSVISKNKFDEIYHLSAQSHVHTSFQVPEYTANINALGTVKLLETIKIFSPESKFYNAATSELYGKILEPIQNENTKFNPQSPYAISKLYSHLMAINYRDSYNLFSCSGILFNHESPRRGKSFVTRKITESVAKIKLGLIESFKIGNLNAKRDWGYAKEYVEAMYLMLQQEIPEEFVIGTGKNYSVRFFIEKTFKLAGMPIVWEGEGVNEKGIIKENNKVVVEIDKFYFRPTEVDVLLADSKKAQQKLKWKPNFNIEQIIETMYENDFNLQNKKNF
jgi:GDPmannose 4,6-dehydratase